eukprot:gnl/TRDRNA2_/TRDRNA2_189670_c0_seq1.p1 gnl/TRDRNA2_/TRDRNA2_189670_c0~~gnl/TRDRNA2_/TRDRNA2_189670_c0_seq1.p1  ORF type:complete len:267 (+),score=44.34 gnl/TRDRNA2_/TRDRNA2_189670_c0_seq1:46-801(+)
MSPIISEAVLDECALDRVVAFVSEPRARICCRSWGEHIYKSLQLEHRIKLQQLMSETGDILYHHSAVRDMGGDFQESVTYQFEFRSSRSYWMQWSRTFDGWTADNECQLGRWEVVGDQVRCCSTPGPDVEEGCVRYARAGLIFNIPVEDVCLKSTRGDSLKPATWERVARGLEEIEVREVAKTEVAVEQPSWSHEQRVPAVAPPNASDARWVEIDGDLYEVSGDIRDLYPEADWQRLMRCRIRFGLNGGNA